MRFFTSLLLLASFLTLSAQSSLTDDYIDQYHNIAITEMYRTGIPASITLAQGLLESNWGRSTLAVKSNNHFGIKCSGNWSGKTQYRFDDDYDKNGKKIKSCFRAYENAEASFVDHSDFLTDPKKTKRYGFLFEFHPEDYQSWAHGLSKAGYATDPKYATKLISIIDKYELHQYDMSSPAEEIIALEENPDFYRINYINSCKVVFAKGGENLKDISSSLGVSSRKLIKYNETIEDRKANLRRGQKIYLESKKNYFLGNEDMHKVLEGEDLASISNEYGINMNYLEKINKLDNGQEIKEGQKIKLKRNSSAQLAMVDKEVMPNKTMHRERPKKHDSMYLFDEALSPIKN